ncbi:MAG: 2-dehydropantoate 2-reductase [Armatimonadota bacterium]|nr:2-dehydropantoate 2-reductase [Armatimonadota bacterium]MDR7401883.1 2-dehydropantoate 2-reductase [Armatimonadota bacterium]MDR7404932.1 2-dehydropantoate 2-reductase [Armatimonadota bacterium]MDR7472066.1 2-dehydropantoate 2-reductase [Armatimonadota bacterium]MDR7507161.1 2-dehydropantoate 2-reductase [Armatimonadota bacterium]
MQFIVVGAGAIGGTVGAYLVRGGHDVLFVDTNAAHVDAINSTGLTVEGLETFTVRARAILPAELRDVLLSRGATPDGDSLRLIDLPVLLCVKAMHTEVALDPIVPVLGQGSYIVSLQNGLNEHAIAARVGPERTVGAFVNFGADYLAPGRVTYGGSGALYFGELDGRISERVRMLADVFRQAFLPTAMATDNIWGYLWGKLGYGSMLFATALVDEPIADVLSHLPSRPMLANLAAETIRVAEAEGVRCEGFDGYDPAAFAFREPRDWPGIAASLDRLVEFNRRSLKIKSGVWRDLAIHRRKTEVDQIVGAVVTVAARHGIPVPLNARLQKMIHDLEEGRRQMHWDNLAELSAVNAEVYGG